MEGVVHGGTKVLRSFEKRKRRRPTESTAGPIEEEEEGKEEGGETETSAPTSSPIVNQELIRQPLAKRTIRRELPSLEQVLSESKELAELLSPKALKSEDVEEEKESEDSQILLKLPAILTDEGKQNNNDNNEKTNKRKNDTVEQDKSSLRERVERGEDEHIKPPGRVAVFETLTPRTKKKVQRLPKPSEAEQERLREIESMFSMPRDHETLYSTLMKNSKAATKSDLKLDSRATRAIKHDNQNQQRRIADPLSLSSSGEDADLDEAKRLEERHPAEKKEQYTRRRRLKRRRPNANRDRKRGLRSGGDNLGKQYEKSNERVDDLKDTIAGVLQQVQQMLPDTALFEHRINNINSKKARARVERLIKRYAYCQHLRVWNQWTSFVEQSRSKELNVFAIRIQRAWIKYACRWELREREELLAKQRTRHAALLSQKINQRFGAALLIQCVFRGFRGRKCATHLVNMEKAALAVQCAWRAKNSRVVLWSRKVVENKRQHAATQIQRVFRGSCGRRRARVYRKVLNVQLAKLERIKRLEKIQKRLIRVGAGVILQAWWRGLQSRWFTRSMVTVLKRRAAIRIQTCWRRFHAKCRLNLMLRLKRERMERELVAATLLQRQFRTRNARRLVQRLREDHEKEMQRKRQERDRRKQDRVVNVMGKALNLTDGHRAFFKVKNRINPFVKAQQTRAATKIQKVFRGHRARRRIKKRRAEALAIVRKIRRDKVRMAALKMQSRWRGIQERRRVLQLRRDLAATKMQALFRSRKARRHLYQVIEKNHAAKVVQSRWRGRYLRKSMAVIRDEKLRCKRAVLKIQTLARMYLSRQRFKDQIELRRFHVESRIQGAKETEAARRLVADDFFIHQGFSSSSKNEQSLGELHALFKEVAGGSKLTSEKFCKTLLQSRSLLHCIDRTSLDLIYAKNKKSQDGAFGFIEFRQALVSLGWHLYLKASFEDQLARFKESQLREKEPRSPGSQSTEERRAERQREKERLREKEAELRSSLVSGFSFRRHRKEQALLLKVFHEHLWWNASFATQSRERLFKQAMGRLEWAAKKVQQRFRGTMAREFMVLFRERRRLEYEAETQRLAATKIQSIVRRFQSRLKVIALVKTVVQKCLDPETQMPYYFNSITEASSWTKPSLLGEDDIETTIRLPSREDEYVVMCVSCKEEFATLACNECRDPFCGDCFRKQHHSSSDHTTTPIEQCSECQYQTVTRFCTGCTRGYCCSCFEIVHSAEGYQGDGKNNPLADHKYLATVKQCVECESRAVKWRCEGCGGDDYCSKCFKRIHRKGKRKGHGYRILSYMSNSVAELERKAKEEAELRMIKKKHLQVSKQMEEEKMLRVAIKLQAIWRGRKDRVMGKKMLREARLEERKHWKQLKADNAERSKLKYKLKNAFGIAPILETDDEDTKLRKMQGWKASALGKIAVTAGAAMPFGEEMPGFITLPEDRLQACIYVNKDWTEVVGPGEYIKLNEQMFQIVRVGDGLTRAEERAMLKKEMYDLKDLAFDKKEEEKMVAKQQQKEAETDAATNNNDGDEDEDEEEEEEEKLNKDVAVATKDAQSLGEEKPKKNAKSRRQRRSSVRLSVTALPRGVKSQRIELDHAFDREADPSQLIKAFYLGDLNQAQLAMIRAKKRADEKVKELQLRAEEARGNLKGKVKQAMNKLEELDVKDALKKTPVKNNRGTLLFSKLKGVTAINRRKQAPIFAEDSDED